MNIAIFASAFHPHFGGVEELCRQLALEYRRRGLGAIVVTNRWPRNLPREEIFEGIPVLRFAMRTPTGNMRGRLNYRLTHAAICRSMTAALRRHAIDLLHIQCVSSNGLYALHAKQVLGLPLVTTLQGELTMDAAGLYQKSEYARALLRRVLANSDAITGCSARTLRDGEIFYGKPFDSRGHVVFNGASVDDFDKGEPFTHARPYILAIGRIVPQKGFDTLLRAYAVANPLTHDLIIAGDGPELPALKDLARDLGISKRVLFPGRADRPAAVALFRGASFFVLPSRADEGLPVVCAEALAAGKAVVATRSGGTPEAVLHEAQGLIVEKEDVTALAAAIARLSSDETLLAHLAAGAKARAQRFSWPTIASQYLALYHTLLPSQHAPLPHAHALA